MPAVPPRTLRRAESRSSDSRIPPSSSTTKIFPAIVLEPSPQTQSRQRKRRAEPTLRFHLRRRRHLRRREPNHEPCARRQIVFHANAAVVFRNNPARDRQAQPRPAFLRREVRQEKPLFILGRNPVPAVGHFDFYRFALRFRSASPRATCESSSLPSLPPRYRSGSPSRAAAAPRSAFTGGNAVASSVFSVIPFKPPVKQLQRARHDRIQIRRRQPRGRESRKLRELHPPATPASCTSRSIKPAHSATSFSNSGCDAAAIRMRSARLIQVPQQPLRRKLNRRQRILDFVRDPLRHFLPRRRLLRAQQIRQIVDHHHESRIRPPRPQRTHRHRRAHQPPAAAISISRDAAPMRSDRRIKCITARAPSSPSSSCNVLRSARVIAQNRHDRRIHPRNLARRRQRNHSRGNIFEDRLHQLAPPLALLDRLAPGSA